MTSLQNMLSHIEYDPYVDNIVKNEIGEKIGYFIIDNSTDNLYIIRD